MNPVYARVPIEPIAVSVRRFAWPIAALGVLIIAWAALRPIVYYHIACASLGNYRFQSVTEHAIAARHPELLLPVRKRGTGSWLGPSYDFSYGRCFTYNNPGGAGAIVQRVVPWSGAPGSESFLFDERLRLKASVRAAIKNKPILNRDGAPGEEAVAHFWRPASERNAVNIVLTIGDGETTILAVVVGADEMLDWYSPVWTNSDGDDLHELEWLSYQPAPAGGVSNFTSVLRLYWTAPGVLKFDGTLPDGFKVWLAPSGGGVRVPADESVEDAALHLLYGWPTSPLPPE